MKTLDEDGDGNIDFDEFKSFMLKANVNSTCEISGEYYSSPHSLCIDFICSKKKEYTNIYIGRHQRFSWHHLSSF